jgi:hypothetical protein
MASRHCEYTVYLDTPYASPSTQVSLATCVVTYLILALLAGIVTFAYPHLRLLYHDTFEMVHRFMGWTATILVWAQVQIVTAFQLDFSNFKHRLLS